MCMNNKVVYAVIVSWNGGKWIRRALESLQKSSVALRTVIVDNASTDDTVDIVQAGFNDVEVLTMPANLGFGNAANQGIRHALSQGADYVLLVNQDARIAPGTVEGLTALLEKHQDFGIVSPLSLTYEGDEIDHKFLQNVQGSKDLISDIFLDKMKTLYDVAFVPAAVWLLSRRILEQVGGFDPVFFMYGEDNDYCNRARYHGFKIGLAPRAMAYHDHGKTAEKSYSFDRYANKFYSECVLRLKRPDHRFFLSFTGLVATMLQRSVVFLGSLDVKKLAATVCAFSRASGNIFHIRRHRIRCRQKGRGWF